MSNNLQLAQFMVKVMEPPLPLNNSNTDAVLLAMSAHKRDLVLAIANARQALSIREGVLSRHGSVSTSETRQTVSSHLATIEDLNAKLRRQQDECRKLADSETDLRNKLLESRKTVSGREATISDVSRQLLAQQDVNLALRTQIEMKTTTVTALQASLASRTSETESKIRSFNTQLALWTVLFKMSRNTLEFLQNDSESAIHRLGLEKQQLKHALDASAIVCSRLEESETVMKNKLTTLRTKNENLDADLTKVRSKHETMVCHFTKLRDDHKTMSSELVALRDDAKVLQASTTAMGSKLVALRDDATRDTAKNDAAVKILNDQIQQLRTDISMLTNTNTILSNHSGNLRGKLDDSEAVVGELQGKVVQFRNIVNQHVASTKRLQGKVDQLQLQLSQRDASITEYQDETGQLQFQLSQRDASISKHQDEASQLRDDIAVLQEEKNLIEVEIQMIRDQLSQCDASTAKHQDEAVQLRGEMAALQEKATKFSSTLAQCYFALTTKTSSALCLAHTIRATAWTMDLDPELIVRDNDRQIDDFCRIINKLWDHVTRLTKCCRSYDKMLKQSQGRFEKCRKDLTAQVIELMGESETRRTIIITMVEKFGQFKGDAAAKIKARDDYIAVYRRHFFGN